MQAVMPGPVRSEFSDGAPVPFPDELFMSAEMLTDTALAALDAGETVTFPTLADQSTQDRFKTARGTLVELIQTGIPAHRYAEATVAS